MDIKFANLVSALASPVLVIILMIFVISFRATPASMLAGVVFGLVGSLPPLFVYARQYIRSSRSSVDLGRNERNTVYLASIFSYALASLIFGSEMYNSLLWFYLSMVFAVFFALMYMVNMYLDKASMHVAMYTLVSITLAAMVNTAFALMLAALPLVIWSRIRLHKHVWVEILWGMAVGLAVGLLVWML